MTGELVPLVMVPRYTGLVGPQTFSTVPLDVTEYSDASLVLWRGPLVGTTPSFTAHFDVSQDAENWSMAAADSSPSANAATAIGAGFTGHRWFRVRIEL